ncbi:MAG: DUF262 domain-containing protein [Dehalococcoidia bacterium]
MERSSASLKVADLENQFLSIEFPEYQRESNVWTRDQKQRLIDSILRQFDIASVYFYVRDDGVRECIDGRQRLNAIMSFLGKNALDDRDNHFQLRSSNEVVRDDKNAFADLDGMRWSDLESSRDDAERGEVVSNAINVVREYRITTVSLYGVAGPDEFNLQFLRLNLGTLINAGEKLHAMVGAMRNLIFGPDGMGAARFFSHVQIPTRRYSKEVTAAQILLQAFSWRASREFARARHIDLQRFVKDHAELAPGDPTVASLSETLDRLLEGVEGVSLLLRNRSVTVSLVLLAWIREVGGAGPPVRRFWEFVTDFLTKLAEQVAKMREGRTDPEYAYLVDFQRHLTQASVERPAVQARHDLLNAELDRWLNTGQLRRDDVR